MKHFKSYLKTVFLMSFFCFFTEGNAQQLKTLIEEGLSKNPKIQSFKLKHQIASEKINESNTLPNTKIGVGYFVSEPETRTGAQRFKISAKQMLPSFGTITARENYLNSVADAVYEDIVIIKRKLVASISKSYYLLYALKDKKEVLEDNIILLKTYEKLALTAIEVGKASAVDVLRLQIRQNELQQLKQILEQNYLAEQTVINKLLNREKNIKITIDTEFVIPSENNLINTNNLTLHPELLKYDKLYKSVEKSELLNQKESNPMFGFGLDYVAVSERPNMDFSDNGKDILMPMISLSIPIFNNKYKSKSKQNKLQQREIISKKENRLNTLETLLDKAIKNSNSARIRFNIQSENLKKAKNAETILVKSYETGTINFNDILDIQELQLKFQINKIEAITAYYLQKTNINYLTN
ncbi:TolC family protein [Tenacibaculum finnmarkense]|uniref:TolC family protein n=1 Tax=Tenacibaculum finnmarkense TaxID=2781243 RepID=UPI001E510B3A|nr:TolC family protein [Tenacibaculum finnmarkense]MCD8422678.1 TolC family protein [Tenacibaculum finnmarkense genomovar ulcerans]MCG8238681.1 TolC family protein [Tenacibaculum finnmarkense genomovar ulcerans]